MVQGTMGPAQILNAATSPVVLISDPGAGKLIYVTSVFFKYNFVSVDYANYLIAQVRYRDVATSLIYSSLANSLTLTGGQDAYRWTTDTFDSVNGAAVNREVVFTTVQNSVAGDGNVFYNISYKIINTADLTVDLT
jgi:hypothetical protein